MEMNAPLRRIGARAASQGFTVLELMITVVILAILLAVVAPSMSTFVASQRVKTSSFDVYSALMYARSEAIKRRSDVTVTSASVDWSGGWTIQAGTSVLRTQDAPKGVTVTSTNATLTYRLDGRLTTSDALLVVESQTGVNQAGRRCITVDTTGLPRSRALTGTATCAP